MRGTLFELLGTDAPSYFVLMAVGFLFAMAISAAVAKRIGQDPDVMVDLGLMMIIAGVLGARVLHVFADGYFWDYVHRCTDPSQVEWKTTQALCLAQPEASSSVSFLPEGLARWLTETPPNVWDAVKGVCRPTVADCFAWARFWSGGLTFYGGFIAATVTAWFLFRRDKFPWWKGVDLAGMTIPIGQGFGRLGCLLAGCCFGTTTDSEVGLVFPGYSPASEWQARAGLLSGPHLESLSVHPTQLYEAVGAFLVAGLCAFWVHGRKRYDGQVFAVYLGSYAAIRFGIEFLRSDDRGGVGGLSTSQWVGLACIAAALGLHWLRRGTGHVTLPVPSSGTEPAGLGSTRS